ncbi:hypothetical protein BTR22_11340 [Alkalihalophilus pseudofirmus]|nr:hypothetical protein BTR22_11340 [Alkalihalophilus pseudofirmus]
MILRREMRVRKVVISKVPFNEAASIQLTSAQQNVYYIEDTRVDSGSGEVYSLLNETGSIPDAGFVVLNNIPVTAEGRGMFEERFQNRAGLVEKEPGFKAIRILRPETSDTYIVMTVWESKDYFKKWQESNAYNHAHKKRGTKEGLGSSIFPRPSYVTEYTI